MNLDNMRQEFPEMPEDMRIMIEREVALQLKTEQSQNNRFARDDEKIVLDSEWESEQERKRDERRNLTQKRSGRKKTGKIFLLTAAAVALMGTTVFAGMTIRQRFFTETEGNYGVNITIGPAETETESDRSAAEILSELDAPEEIPVSVTVEASWIPDGMVQYDDGWKIDYEDDIYGGSFSITEEIMDENPTETLISVTNVVDSEELELNGHYAVWVELDYLEGSSDHTVQKLYILYPEIWRILTIYSTNDEVTKDELLKVAEGLSLTGSEETMLLKDAYTMGDAVEETEMYGDYDPEGVSTTVEVSAVEENLHQIGDSFELSAYSECETDEEFNHTVGVRVSDVQVSDQMNALGDDWQSILDSGNYSNDLSESADEDGNLLPVQIDYVKAGDGVDSLNTVIKTEEVEQKLICATIEFTNNGEADLHNVLYNASLMTLIETGDGMMIFYDRSTQEEGDWDYATVSCGYEMDYYTAGGDGTNGSNYITDLLAGETATVTVAWIVRADEMPYLYLNMGGAAIEFTTDVLEEGYVDFRALEY